MEIIASLDNWKKQEPLLVAIGNFDGLHLGHQALLEELIKQTREIMGKSMVLTFDPHPLALLTGKTPSLLLSAEQKEAYLEQMGIDYLYKMPFDLSLAKMEPEDFFADILWKGLAASRFLVGFNYNFGRSGKGNAELLAQLAEKKGLAATIIKAVSLPFGIVSSTAIRKHLAAGEIEQANLMLGYAFNRQGRVMAGNQLGRDLGFPTANLPLDFSLQVPPRGVYGVRVIFEEKQYHGVANVGARPTVDGISAPILEVHLLNYKGDDFYGSKLKVFFDHFFRPEQRFKGIEELKQQISKDYQNTSNYYNQNPPLAPIW